MCNACVHVNVCMYVCACARVCLVSLTFVKPAVFSHWGSNLVDDII